MGISFLSPFFLAGLLAASVPIVIHLMQRKKARVVDFGSLRFLKEVHARLSMRQKIREMVLLALRVLLILLIVLAMAKPVLRGASVNSKVDAPVTMIFIVDNTLSMSAQVGGVSNFERARTIIQTEAEAMKNDDRIAIIPLINTTSGEARVTNKQLPPGPLLDNTIAELKQGYGTGDPVSALRFASNLLNDSETLNNEIYLLSDFQTTTFEDFSKDSVAEALKESNKEIAVYVVNFAGAGIRSAAPRRGYFKTSGATGKAMSVLGEVVNFSQEQFDIKLSLVVDGKKTSEILYNLTPEERWEFSFDINVETEGFHKCQIILEGDDVSADNTLNLSHFSTPSMNVLLVDGRPSPVSSLDAAYYVRCALDPRWKKGIHGVAGFTATVITPEEFTEERLENQQIVFLIDLPDFTLNLRDSIVDFVRAGGGLVVIPGANTNFTKYAGAFSSKINSEPYFPGMALGVEKAPNEDGYFVNFSSISLQHPVWAGIQEKSLQVLCNEPMEAILHLEEDLAVAEREVLASFNNSWPAIVSSRLGTGRIVQFAFSLDTQWSGLPLKPIFPLLCHRITQYSSGSLSNLRGQTLVGKPLNLFLRKTSGDMKFKISYPNNEITLSPRLKEAGFYVEAPAAIEPGFVQFHPVKNASFLGQLIAINTPSEESYTEFAPTSNIIDAFDGNSAYQVEDPAKLAEVRTRLKSGSPLWGYLLILALIILAVESWLANNVLGRISAGRKAEAATYGVLSKKAIVSLRKRRGKKEAS